MSILKYKYKAHKFINYAFYIVVFIFGFLLGFTTQKLDFNKLISQVLMIDSVSAYTIYEDDNSIYDEIFIYDSFSNNFSDFNLTNYPYIYCFINGYADIIQCSAFDDIYLSRLIYIPEEMDDLYQIGRSASNDNIGKYIYFDYNVASSEFLNYGELNFPSYSNGLFAIANSSSAFKFFHSYSNFDLSLIDPILSVEDEISNVLDFTKFSLDYKLNDGSIFEDENHQDFKKYCWENFNELVFSVTINDSYDGSFNVYQEDQQDGETYIKSGFYVFDDIFKLKRGTRMRRVLQNDKYDTSTWLSGLTFDHLYNVTTDFDILHTDEKLYARYSDTIDALGNYDIERQDSYYYDNLYKLKNSNYVDFTYYYNPINDYSYDIFHLQESKENFCIYVPNVFVVTTLQLNELGGFVGDIPVHNDSNDSFIDVTETTGKLQFNQLFSIINKFISSIKETVVFINSTIYSFFTALHPLIQMFIFTFITLLVVKLIIGMVVK